MVTSLTFWYEDTRSFGSLFHHLENFHLDKDYRYSGGEEYFARILIVNAWMLPLKVFELLIGLRELS